MEINDGFWTAIGAALPKEVIEAPCNVKDKLPPLQQGEVSLGELNEGERNLLLLRLKCEYLVVGLKTKYLEEMKSLAPFPPHPLQMMEKMATLDPEKKARIDSYAKQAEMYASMLSAFHDLMWKSVECRLSMAGKSLALRGNFQIVRIKGLEDMLEELSKGAQDVNALKEAGFAHTAPL